MIRTIYTSAAVAPFTHEALRTLLARARPRNTDVEISGVLLHIDGWFLQVLEGPPAAVDATFARISADPRHDRVLVLLRSEIEERGFPDWSMGFVDASGRAAGVAGYRATNGFGDLQGDASALLRVVHGFRDGRWRTAAA